MRSIAILGAAALTMGLGPLWAQDAKAPAAAESALKTGPASIAAHWSKYQYPQSIPEGASYYVVEKGDTLWHISARFLNSPFLWPQIWDQNKYITDAHWIYPGDPLIIPNVQVVSDGAGKPAEIEEEAPPAPAPAAAPDVLVPLVEEAALQCAPYVVDGNEDEGFYIIGSERGAEKVAYSLRDILYLNKGSNAGVKPGDVYTLHHATYDIHHPETNRRIGLKVHTTGWLRILLTAENSSTAIVEGACSDIHAGDYLRPFKKVNVPLVVRKAPNDRMSPPSGKANGAIVDIGIEDNMIAAEGHFVIINLGSRNGIAPGNMFTVYRIMYPTVPTSRLVIGELGVVAVHEKTALARVTFSNDALFAGDRVELN